MKRGIALLEWSSFHFASLEDDDDDDLVRYSASCYETQSSPLGLDILSVKFARCAISLNLDRCTEDPEGQVPLIFLNRTDFSVQSSPFFASALIVG